MSTVNGKVAPSAEIGAALPSLVQTDQGPGPSVGRLLWDAWKAYSHRAGRYQSQVLLSSVYFGVLGPSASVARVAGTKLLDLDRSSRPSYWIERKPVEKTLAALERQF